MQGFFELLNSFNFINKIIDKELEDKTKRQEIKMDNYEAENFERKENHYEEKVNNITLIKSQCTI